MAQGGAILCGTQFRSFALRHVERDAKQPLRAAALRASTCGHPSNAAIGLDNPILDVEFFVRRKRLCHGALEPFAELRRGSVEELLRRDLAVLVLDARGSLKAAAVQDGSSLKRADIAYGKAHGAIALGVGSRALFVRSEQQPSFIAAAGAAIGGALVPVPGGVLIRDASGALLGAVGISGDTSDNDEAAALAGIAAAGLAGETG